MTTPHVRSLLAVAAAATLVGCGGSSSSPAPAESSTSAAPSAADAIEASPLADLALSADEVGGTVGTVVNRRLQPGGDEVAGQVTLDLCAKTFPSEQQRLERLQVAYVQPAGEQLRASEEIVRYEPGGTTAAYREVRKAARSCPHRVELSQGVVAKGIRTEPRDPSLPDRQLIESTQFRAPGRPPVWTAAAYMYDGDLFIGTYVFAGSRTDALHDLAALAGAAAGKLQSA